jgi:hypothetical protein
MKLYFGRIPDNSYYLDIALLDAVKRNEYNFENAVEYLFETKFPTDTDIILHTLNPLLLNYLDDYFAKEYLYFIDKEGNHIKCGDDSKFLKNLEFMQVGEAICDDSRVFV